MDYRRRPLRGRDVISLGRKTPRCNFMEIREEIKAIRTDLLSLNQNGYRTFSYRQPAAAMNSDNRKR